MQNTVHVDYEMQGLGLIGHDDVSARPGNVITCATDVGQRHVMQRGELLLGELSGATAGAQPPEGAVCRSTKEVLCEEVVKWRNVR